MLRPLFVSCRVGDYPPPNPEFPPPKSMFGLVYPELAQRMDSGQTSIEVVTGCLYIFFICLYLYFLIIYHSMRIPCTLYLTPSRIMTTCPFSMILVTWT